MKNRKLNQWLWKWHFIAGLISLPFVLVLSITGAIYLFNPDVEKEAVANIQDVIQTSQTPISYQKQWEIAKQNMKKQPNSMILNDNPSKSTEFISGRFSHKKSLFVNQYTGEVKGLFTPKDTWMYSVRKLHGELLGGKVGTKIVELVASWLVVLIITGLYVWYPFVGGIKGVFTIRIKEGKQIFFRDLHAVTGFWISALLIITLAGGFPWTDVFGANYKWVQKVTNTGYPKEWHGIGLKSTPTKKALTLDEMIAIAKKQPLKGQLTFDFPKHPKGTFAVSNKTFPLDTQQKIHFDQYSGKIVKHLHWSDVGILMRSRMWVMAFHQGQFGGWNWWVMFLLSIALTVMSIAALVHYLFRKQPNKWGVPKVPKSFSVGKGIIAILILLGIIFPMLGISLVLIILSDFLIPKSN